VQLRELAAICRDLDGQRGAPMCSCRLLTLADRSPQVGVIHCVGRLKFGKLPARDKGDAGTALGDCAPQHAIGPVRVLRWRRQPVRILPRATEFSRSWPLLNAKPVGTRPSRDVAFGINATIPLRYDPIAKALAALLILKLHLHGRSTGARALWGKKNQDQYEGVHGPSSGPPLCLPVKSSESIDRLSHLGPNRHAGMEC